VEGTDADNIRRIAQGDVAALADVIDAYGQRVKQYAYNRVRNEDEAEEVAHVALLQFYLFVRESPDAHERYPRIVPLLVTTVKNLLYDGFHQRQIEQKLKATLLGAPRRRLLLPDQKLLGKELMEKAWAVLRRLPKPWRDLAYMVFFDDYKIVEAAEETGIPSPASTSPARSSPTRSASI